MKCTCMHDLEFPKAQRKQVVAYLVDFATLSKVQQQTLVIQWIKYSDVIRRTLPYGERLNPKVFLLPGTEEMICGHGLQRILGYGRDAWKTIKDFAKKNEIPKHGLIGKHGNKMNIVMQEDCLITLRKQSNTLRRGLLNLSGG